MTAAAAILWGLWSAFWPAVVVVCIAWLIERLGWNDTPEGGPRG